MSVYTEVPRAALEEFLAAHDLGTVLAFEGILEGVENTNYFLSTRSGEYVLTLFEATPPASLGYCLELMAHLAARGARGLARGRCGPALVAVTPARRAVPQTGWRLMLVKGSARPVAPWY